MDTWILEALRTPVGFPGGGLIDLLPHRLMKPLLQQMQQRFQQQPFTVDAFFIAQALNYNASSCSDHSIELYQQLSPRVCELKADALSSFEALAMAQAQLSTGTMHSLFIGGQESASQWLNTGAPPTSLWNSSDPSQIASLFMKLNEARAVPDVLELKEQQRRSLKFTREHLDEFALLLAKRLTETQERDLLFDYLCPLVTEGGWVVESDEALNDPVTAQRLIAADPLEPRSSFTALNTAQCCDGAALFWLASDEWLHKTGQTPLAKIDKIDFFPNTDALIHWLQDYLTTAQETFQKRPFLEICTEFSVDLLEISVRLELPKTQLASLGGTLAKGAPLGCMGLIAIIDSLAAMNENDQTQAIVLGQDPFGRWASVRLQLPESSSY